MVAERFSRLHPSCNRASATGSRCAGIALPRAYAASPRPSRPVGPKRPRSSGRPPGARRRLLLLVYPRRRQPRGVQQGAAARPRAGVQVDRRRKGRPSSARLPAALRVRPKGRSLPHPAQLEAGVTGGRAACGCTLSSGVQGRSFSGRYCRRPVAAACIPPHLRAPSLFLALAVRPTWLLIVASANLKFQTGIAMKKN